MIENRIPGHTRPCASESTRMAEYLHLDAKRAELAALEAKAAEPGFWDDQSSAQTVMAQAAGLRDEIEGYEAVVSALDDAEVANELAVAEDDEELAAEVAPRPQGAGVAHRRRSRSARGSPASSTTATRSSRSRRARAVSRRRTGPRCCCACTRSTPSRKKWKIDLHDAPAGVELGIDRAVFTVHGRNAYGMLLSEIGVHRLVRISPTDEKKRRQTTFAGVEVLPVLPDDVEVEIRDEDLRIDVYRSSGPGGQSVNTTDSAVRITHIPTRPRRHLPEREEPAQEQGRRDEDPALAPLRAREGRSARPSSTSCAARSATSPSAARSATTCCTRTRWSRTCAPASRPATSTRCSTATSTSSWSATTAGASRRGAGLGGDHAGRRRR